MRGWRVVELPATHRPRVTGTGSLRALRLVRFSLRALGQLLAFRVRLRRLPATGDDVSTSVPAQATFSLRRENGSRARGPGSPPGGARRFRSRRMAAVALVLRLIGLDDKAMHHDESQHAWFALAPRTGEGYSYDPVFHGPVQFYSSRSPTSCSASATSSRACRRRSSGRSRSSCRSSSGASSARVAALTASVASASARATSTSPASLREDIHVATVNLALLVVLIRFLDRPRAGTRSRCSVCSSPSRSRRRRRRTSRSSSSGSSSSRWSCSEAIGRGRGGRGVARHEARARRRARSAWRVGMGRRDVPHRLHAALLDVPHQPAGPAGGPGRQHRLLALAAARQPRRPAVVLLPRPDPGLRVAGRPARRDRDRRGRQTADDHAARFLVWMFVCSLADLLVGVRADAVARRAPAAPAHPARRASVRSCSGISAPAGGRGSAIAATAVLAVGWVYSSVQLSYFRSADPRELLVQVQSSDDVPVIRDELVRLRAAADSASDEPHGRSRSTAGEAPAGRGAGTCETCRSPTTT